MIVEYRGQLKEDEIRFHCFNCNSRFVATKDEVKVDNSCTYGGNIPPWYVCICPVCGKECRK